jgi:hypothetical protein
VGELYYRDKQPTQPENIEIKPEEEVSADKKGTYVLQSGLEKAKKEVRDKKAAEDDYMLGYVLKLLGGIGLRIGTQLMNSIYVTGKWPKDFIEVKLIAINKKTKATKCSYHRTISLIAHTTKIVARILRRGFVRKTEDVLGEDQLDLEE